MSRQLASFTIQACDAGGSSQRHGGDPFVVAVRGPSLVHAKVTDTEDGSYKVDYKACTSGQYNISVTLHGAPLVGSPFALTIMRPRPHAAKCVVRGVERHARVREPAGFEVEFRDIFGCLTHAEELDCFVVFMSCPTSPRGDNGGSMPSPSRLPDFTLKPPRHGRPHQAALRLQSAARRWLAWRRVQVLLETSRAATAIQSRFRGNAARRMARTARRRTKAARKPKPAAGPPKTRAAATATAKGVLPKGRAASTERRRPALAPGSAVVTAATTVAAAITSRRVEVREPGPPAPVAAAMEGSETAAAPAPAPAAAATPPTAAAAAAAASSREYKEMTPSHLPSPSPPGPSSRSPPQRTSQRPPAAAESTRRGACRSGCSSSSVQGSRGSKGATEAPPSPVASPGGQWSGGSLGDGLGSGGRLSPPTTPAPVGSGRQSPGHYSPGRHSPDRHSPGRHSSPGTGRSTGYRSSRFAPTSSRYYGSPRRVSEPLVHLEANARQAAQRLWARRMVGRHLDMTAEHCWEGSSSAAPLGAVAALGATAAARDAAVATMAAECTEPPLREVDAERAEEVRAPGAAPSSAALRHHTRHGAAADGWHDVNASDAVADDSLEGGRAADCAEAWSSAQTAEASLRPRQMDQPSSSSRATVESPLLFDPGLDHSGELLEDPHGISFALGELYPGTLHAHGLVPKAHRLHYSIGRAGTYSLWIGLRQQSTLLPGCPFTVEVTPGAASPHHTRVAIDELPLSSVVGEMSRGVRVAACDVMGNRCVSGGAPVRVSCPSSEVTAHIVDNLDGTYVHAVTHAATARRLTMRQLALIASASPPSRPPSRLHTAGTRSRGSRAVLGGTICT